MIEIKIKPVCRDGRRGHMPLYGTDQAAAADLLAFLSQPLTLMPMQRAAVPCGIAIEMPRGVCAFVMARSGLALKHGITMANGVGLIDSDYRGEILAALVNLGDAPFVIEDGMRIAQLAIMRHEEARFVESQELGQTKRGQGGFGSTGLKEI